MKTPILRFPTCVEKGGTWQPFKVEDLGKFLRGQTYSRNKVTGACTDVLIIRSSNLKDAWYVDVSVDPQYVSIEVSDELQLKKDDVVICTANGSTSLVGKASIYDGQYKGRVSWGAFCAVFRPTNELSKYFFSTNRYKKLISIHKQGGNGALANLNIQAISKEEIYFPVLEEEQQKISSFFTALDEKIFISEKRLACLETLKKGVVQKIFSQKIRFKREDGTNFNDWALKPIGSIGHISTGSTPKTSNEEYFGGQYLWVTPTDISGKEIINTARTLTEAGLAASRIIPANSILVTCIASIGKNCILRGIGSCNQQINAITPNELFDPDFVYYAMCKNEQVLHANAGRGGMEILNKSDFSNIEILFPCKDEQKKISESLTTVDEKISIVRKRLVSLHLLKKSLMQQMFV